MLIRSIFFPFLQRLNACLPIGYQTIVLDEDDNDIACDWRRIRIYKYNINTGNQYKEIRVTSQDYDMSMGMISEKYVQPFLNC